MDMTECLSISHFQRFQNASRMPSCMEQYATIDDEFDVVLYLPIHTNTKLPTHYSSLITSTVIPGHPHVAVEAAYLRGHRHDHHHAEEHLCHRAQTELLHAGVADR